MRRGLALVLVLATVGCGSSGSGGGAAAGTGGTAASGGGAGGAGGSGAVSGAGGTSGTAGTSGSGGTGGAAGAANITCFDMKGGPTLLVVQDAAGKGGKAETVLRVPLQLTGPATGLALDAVEERDGADQSLRAWKAADFAGPPGFDGSVVADSANQYGVVLAASAEALPAETEACALEPWKRAGKIVVSGKTNEGGAFQLECPLALGLGAKGPESQRFACAKGVAGWLYGQTGLSNVAQPVTAALADSAIHVANVSGDALGGFSATSAKLHAYFADDFFPPCSAPPPSWDFPAGGKHDLWKGQSSNEIWTGPVPPQSEEWANWMWQLVGAQFPSGVCFKPSTTPPEPGKECMNPVLQLELGGTSSAGAWQWQSDLFQCYDLSGM